ncbi:helicase HerA-like domain-containing protein [Magnetospirillum gryphiswaldense]|uniref:helicase HerA-like domain-containing protein n=1 Tax=Magnetospirillum gryphiswaldense TaxID=55518 RepID=UPI000D03BA4F|nr:helicase HerA-like domain-containing protein [Magnetospirillum gryphiswaldense]AVM74839.1 AAA-like domain protein [Magnetospirillum gryphiswaldense MSR-1]AVM78742.1 AAA-like domain protein [Magnetospirillum gryphiswaldense]
MAEKIFIGGGESPLWLDLSVANRHGLIAGATGTGKTVSLRVLAEGFSAAGVPVFMADVKGDLGGLAKPGETSPRIAERAAKLKLDWQGAGLPVVFWDLFGRQGHPVRATVSDIGPILLARMLGLTDVQEGVLNVAFRYADDEGLLLLDLKDLRALISYVGENANQLNSRYGAVASSSVGAIQRALLALENQGGDSFFGEPALDFADLMMVAPDGRGAVNVLAADELMKSPALYATFLLWMLSELFESLPEVGDVAKPKLVFFFDEAHLLFNDAPAALVTQVEQVVRLIRSKGVGVYFVTQSPLDIPETVLGQLGHRIQHALRAFTPRDQKAVRAAAETFRPNPRLDTAQAIQELGKGEALVSLLDGDGIPGMVQRALIAPPATSLSVLADDQRRQVMEESPVKGEYEAAIDRDSAYERLTARASPVQDSAPTPQHRGAWGRVEGAPPPSPRRRPATDTIAEAAVKSVARGLASSLGSALGRQIVRGVLGAILKR